MYISSYNNEQVELKRGDYTYYTSKRGVEVKIMNDCGYLLYEREMVSNKNGITSVKYVLVKPTKEMLKAAKACQIGGIK